MITVSNGNPEPEEHRDNAIASPDTIECQMLVKFVTEIAGSFTLCT
jgi:hypothetical protein